MRLGEAQLGTNRVHIIEAYPLTVGHLFGCEEGVLHPMYPLVNCHIAMERSTMFNGKIHYFYGHFQ
jgi:hypothetical protein